MSPVFVTRQADAARADAIAEQFLTSMTLGAGQFCTKPGVLFVPENSTIPTTLQRLALPAAAPLLNEQIQSGYISGLSERLAHPDVTTLVQGDGVLADPPTPTIVQTSVGAVCADRTLFTECFGPTALVVTYRVTYRDESELIDVANGIEGQLTATIIGEGDEEVIPELVRLLEKRAGRLLWNQWPTGVSVTFAQHTGGPTPRRPPRYDVRRDRCDCTIPSSRCVPRISTEPASW